MTVKYRTRLTDLLVFYIFPDYIIEKSVCMNKLFKVGKTKIFSFFFSLFIVVVIIVFSGFNVFGNVKHNMEDRFYQKEGKILSDIVILGIDTQSINEIGKWPWPRSIMAELTEIVSKGNPSVIGFDILFTGSSFNSEDDKRLTETLEKAGNVVIATKGTLNETAYHDNRINASEIEVPYDDLLKHVHTGHINNILDEDKVARTSLYSFFYDEEEIRSFDLKIYELFMKHTTGSYIPLDIPTDKLNRWYVTYTGEPFSYENHSIVEVLNKNIPAEYFENKIVLIGPFDYGMQDSYITPLNHSLQMHGVEIHANIIQNLITQNFKQRLDPKLEAFIIIFISILAFMIYRKAGPLLSLAAAIALAIVSILASKAAFDRGYIPGFFYYILAVVLLYLINIIVKYLEEFLERKRITGAFGKYVAPQVVEKIIKDGEEALNLGGIRREITALFVDIRGFTPMSEKVEPEEVVGILNEYLNLTAVSIFDNEGTLDKFMGDATMAIFNAPVEINDHAFKAVKTAWAMKEGSKVLKKSLEEKYGHSVQFGIGINTGFAVVGNIGAKFRMDYTAIGDTVNTAARLESNAKYGQILISSSTYEMVKDRVICTCLGEISVKGKSKGITVYQVDGMKEDI